VYGGSDAFEFLGHSIRTWKMFDEWDADFFGLLFFLRIALFIVKKIYLHFLFSVFIY